MNWNVFSTLVTAVRTQRPSEARGKESIPAAPPYEAIRTRRRFPWLAAAIGGGIFTALVFLFLGSLQPPVNSSERLELPQVLTFDLEATKARKPPPPPPKPEKQKPKERKRVRPKTQTKTVARTTRSLSPRRTRSSAAPRMRADIARGLAGISLSAAGSGLGGGGLALDLSGEAMDFAAEAADFLQYQERRRMARERQFSRERTARRSASTSARAARLEHRARPVYPYDARKNEIEGWVVFDMLVGIDGAVEECKVIDGSPPGEFEDAILAIAPRWQFSPAKDDTGRPIEEWVRYRYEFKLEDA